ncbi:hypothetical protein CBS101457_004147 [Exobasidium rhododendri]|nr:hypothetical protein CBS101457_004147 [Exobasidium rhododendri]
MMALPAASDSSSADSKKRKGSPSEASTTTTTSPLVQSHKHQSSIGAKSDGSCNSPNNGDKNTSSNHKKSASQQADKVRRIKTQRACDSCRRKKIRCDVIDDGGPITGNVNNGNGGLTCAHCKQYGFDCTFFLPITETRFKKKREREAEELATAAAAAAASAASSDINTRSGSVSRLHPPAVSFMSSSPFRAPSMMPSHSFHSTQDSSVTTTTTTSSYLDAQTNQISASQEWPRRRPESGSSTTTPSSSREQDFARNDVNASPKGSASASVSSKSKTTKMGSDTPPPPDTRVLGPTSIAYVVHSTAFVPGAAIEQHDLKHNQTFEVGASGDGIIKFHKPPKGHASFVKGEEGEDDEDADTLESLRIPESVRGRLAGDVAEKLVNTYFEKIGFLFPIVTKSEFLHLSPPPPLLLYAICGVAALSRDVPKEVLTAVKSSLNSLFRHMDLLSNSSNLTVKALLIMSLHSDLHGNTAVQGGTRCWNRVGAAIRMAQDLGLHRDASGRDDLDDDAFFLEQKRRIWGCCVTADRCMSVSLGHPLGIDLTDCDVRLPSPHEILRYSTDVPSDPTTDRPFAFNTEMLKLSILFGRVMKTVYSPTGLMKTTDEDMVGLLNDIDRWKEMLPTMLQFKGATESSAPAGILHVLFACLLHLLFRVFMRISYNCPKHLSFSLTIERMTSLIRYTRESIEWVDLNDFYLDTFQFVSYGLVFCTTVQYHAWIRRGDHLALASLKRAKVCVTRFKRQGEESSSEELSMRAKTAEVISMLYDSGMGAYAHGTNTGNLNPTAGVTNRRTADTVRGIVFKQDQSRPGGGVYVAQNPHFVLDDLPRGTIILQEIENGNRVPALVRTDDESNGGWQPINDGMLGNAMMASLPSTQKAPPSSVGSPAAADLTYVAGDVYTDAEGRPVNRRGSRLLTMIPVQTNEQGNNQQQYPYNASTRLSFSDISVINPNKTIATDAGNGAQSSSSFALNDAAWLNAMTNTMNSNALPNMNTFHNGGYTIEGQYVLPSQAFLGGLGSGEHQSGNVNEMQANSTSTFGTMGHSSNNPTASATAHFGSNGNNAVVDPLSLDEMPGGPLDFAAWDSWFRSAGSSNSDGAVGLGHQMMH